MKLVTWNVNSLKARLPRVLEFLAEHEPDVLCLQETRTEPEAFPPGEPAARERMDAWVADGVQRYAERRNTLSGGSSRLSPYLRFGALSVLELAERGAAVGGEGPDAYLGELAWRDFYAEVLLHFPDNAKLEMQERYRGTLAWSDDPEQLAAWAEGDVLGEITVVLAPAVRKAPEPDDLAAEVLALADGGVRLKAAARKTILDGYALKDCLPRQIAWVERAAGMR